MGNGGLLIRWVTYFGHSVAGNWISARSYCSAGKAHFYEGLTLDDPGFISNEPAYRI